MQLSQELKFVVLSSAFDVVPEEATPEQLEELENMNQARLWQHVAGENAVELHDLHQEIYKEELDFMDTMYQLICKMPGINVAYMNILAQTGRTEELNKYLRSLL